METGSPRSRSDRKAHAPWLFLFATLGWTWTCWWAIAAMPVATGATGAGPEQRGALILLLYAAGGFGPAIVATLLVMAKRADETLRSFWRRAVDPRLLRPRGWLFVVLLGVGPSLAVWLAASLETGTALSFGTNAFLLVGAVAGFAEEPGWRGYAQEGLQRRLPVAAAALIVGAFWAVWHLPLFWIAGTWQYEQGAGTGAFWMFLGGLVVLGVSYAWLYNVTGRVTLAAVALHAVANVASEAFAVDGAEPLELAIDVLVAVALVASGWRWMRRRAGPAGCHAVPADRAEAA